MPIPGLCDRAVFMVHGHFWPLLAGVFGARRGKGVWKRELEQKGTVSENEGWTVSFTPGEDGSGEGGTPLGILRYQPADSRRLFRCLGAHLPKSPFDFHLNFEPPKPAWRSPPSLFGIATHSRLGSRRHSRFGNLRYEP